MDILLSQYSNNLFRLPVRVLSALVLSLENRLVLLNAKTPCDDVTVMRDVSWTLSLYFKINVYHLQENTVTVTEVLHYSPKEFLLDKEPFRCRKTLSKTV